MKLILDTCTFVWLCAEPSRLSDKAKKLLKDQKNTLSLSEVSVMEICFKAGSGKLALPSAPPVWIEAQLEAWQLQVLPITRSVIYRSGELPFYHKDPFDRLLIASAIEERGVIVSPDREFERYPVTVTW